MGFKRKRQSWKFPLLLKSQGPALIHMVSVSGGLSGFQATLCSNLPPVKMQEKLFQNEITKRHQLACNNHQSKVCSSWCFQGFRELACQFFLPQLLSTTSLQTSQHSTSFEMSLKKTFTQSREMSTGDSFHWGPANTFKQANKFNTAQ